MSMVAKNKYIHKQIYKASFFEAFFVHVFQGLIHAAILPKGFFTPKF